MSGTMDESTMDPDEETPCKASEDDATKTREQFSEGLLSLLRPVVTELDSRVKATRHSQIQLRQQIDSLAEDLRIISDQYQSPYDLEAYVKKLQDSKKRVAVVSSILQNSQEKLLKLQQNINKETLKRKSLLEPPTPAPP